MCGGGVGISLIGLQDKGPNSGSAALDSWPAQDILAAVDARGKVGEVQRPEIAGVWKLGLGLGRRIRRRGCCCVLSRG